jgi:hypothetical protein
MNYDALKQLAGLIDYILKHPEERFFQALRNWSKEPFILTAKKFKNGEYLNIKDTFYK